jgi:hypothetical protein
LSRVDPPETHTEQIADLVHEAKNEAMRRSEARDALFVLRARRERLKHGITWLLLVVLIPLVILLSILNLTERMPIFFGRPSLSAEARRHQALADVSFAVEAIEQYRARLGKLPANLGAVDIRGGSRWNYEVVDSTRYRVALTDHDTKIAYDSAVNDAAEFFASVRTRPPGAGR